MATTYSTLQAEIANWALRDDLTSEIQSCIQFAEARFNRTLFCTEREASQTLTTELETVSLPSDYSALRSIHVVADPITVLEQLTLFELRQQHASSEAGTPENYAISNGTLILGPAPSNEVQIIVNYYRTIPALTDSNTTNWLLTAHPDLYLAASLVEVYLLLKDEQRATLWDGKAARLIEEVKRNSRRKTHSGPPMRLRNPGVVV